MTIISKSRLIILVGTLYVVWSILYIINTSFVAMDGNRYYSLVDDAMISMRYAWNLSHGNGLVWNIGERVEGYSNLLMTLLMSLATWVFDKKFAVLAVQVLGIPTVLISALLTQKISLEVYKEKRYSNSLGIMVFIITLFYYPLSYWSLLGMETGLVALFMLAGTLYSLRWICERSPNLIYLSALFLGLSFLTRNDSLIFTIVEFSYIAWILWKEMDKTALRSFLIAISIYSGFVFIQSVFRWFYYGELMPNTYALKLGQIPFSVRINDGLLYISHFIKESWFFLLLALIAFVISTKPWKWLFFGLLAVAILYQVWTGGDAWLRWRFIVPSMPFVFILIVGSLFMFFENLLRNRESNDVAIDNFSTMIGILSPAIVSLFLLVSLINPYRGEISLSKPTPDNIPNRHNTDVAIAINAVTNQNATIGVFWAGVIPYYTDRYAVDFLGKSDKYIAGLYPQLPPKVTWFHQTTLPGHNKYDLFYSIKTLTPTYIQGFRRGKQILWIWAIQNYVRLEYKGVSGALTLILEKNSPDVYWNKGTIIPWPEK